MSQSVTSDDAASIRSNEDSYVHSSESKLKKGILEKLRKLIGSNVTVKQYNKFLERKAPRGYKYQRHDNCNVFIIDMSKSEHGDLVALLITSFVAQNAGFPTLNRPFIVHVDTLHHNPVGTGKKIAPGVAIAPNELYIPKPIVPHP
ncbi:14341_t:CDS:2, partial [Cetraspora pellucida]